jgi:GNAT superfamily N-acetyltransferase
MAEFVIEDFPIPAAVGAAGWDDFLESVTIRNEVAIEQQGPDAIVSAEELLPRAPQSPEGNRLWAVARVDGHVVGRAFCVLPFNREAPESTIVVEVFAKFRRGGIGTALLGWALNTVRADGRSVAQNQMYVFARDGAETISPANGMGSIPIDEPGSAFALRNGATLAQVTRTSDIALPADEALLGPLEVEALAASDASYRTVIWTGATPANWEDDIAELHTRMTTDAPQGDLTITEDVWDAESVRLDDNHWLGSGWQLFYAASVSLETGQLVAYSEISALGEASEIAYQLETLVLREHRGHRLGTLLKIANLRALHAARPAVRKVRTGNAEENQPMLRVNEALGFVPVSYAAEWKLEL